MTTSDLASRIPAVRPREVRAEEAPPATPALFQPRNRPPFFSRYGRALAFSLVLHLVLAVLAPRFVILYSPPAGGGGALAPGNASEQTTYLEIALTPPGEIVPLSEVSADQPPIDISVIVSPPRVVPPTTTPTESVGELPTTGAGQISGTPTGGATQGLGVAGAPSGTTSEGGGSGAGAAAAALRPGYRDGRLYVESPLLPDLEKTPEQRYAEHLSARMEAVRDSINMEASRADLTPDWVHTDASGNRWGLSDEGLHLGPITIPRSLVPSPRSTGDTRTQQDALERQRQREEIERQEADRARRATQQERNRAAEEARGSGR